MNDYPNSTQAQAQVMDAGFSSSVESSKVLRNTYTLLAMTLAFSALCAGIGMAVGMPYVGLWMLLPYFVLLWLVEKNKNNAMGIVLVFALTGWLGLTLSPMLSFLVAGGAADIIVMSLAGTAAIFFVTSGYVLVTRKNLNFMSGFLITGIMVAFFAGIANVFFQIPGLGLAVSCLFLIVSSGLIMWQTSEIIHGGETNYISATVTLFVMLYNIFVSLLSIFMSMED